jgi:membrane fusion protein (multidrug efflux system)
VSGSDTDEQRDETRRRPERDSEEDEHKDEKPRSKLPLIIGGGVIVIAIIAGIIYWLATRNEVTTDDAYTNGRAVSIASNVSGYCTALYVDDNTYVHAGDLLLTIDPREDEAAVRQAQANLTLAKAQVAYARVNVQEIRVRAPAQLLQAQAQLAQAQAQEVLASRNYRREITADQRATAGADIDQAAEQLRAAEAAVQQAQAQVTSAALIPQQLASAGATLHQDQAQLQQAEANLTQAQVKLSYNEIRAPQDGTITMRNVERGTYVQAGQQVFYIVTPQVWVTANFKETQLARIAPGEHVTMTVDAYPNLLLHGHIQSIQEGSGARFTAFPAENATGNFVKIVRRVPVKILIDNGLPKGMDGLPPNVAGLPLGISVEPTVDLK